MAPLLPLLLLLSPLALRADQYGPWTYTSDGVGITIERYNSDSDSADIPSTLAGLPVTTIGAFAFYPGHYDVNFFLGSVSIPETVSSIDPDAFRMCTVLSAITVDPLNPYFTSVDGVVFNKDQRRLLSCPEGKPGDYAVPDGVRSIEFKAFARCQMLSNVVIPDSVTSIATQAFWVAANLASVTVGSGVTNIGDFAFGYCSNAWRNPVAFLFQGNAPRLGGNNVFVSDVSATVYYLPGTTGWGPIYGGRPTALWYLPNPVILNLPPTFGVQNSQFGFRISWATNASVIVDAATDPANPTWLPVATNALAAGWSDFSDPGWTNFPARFYRLRSP